VVLILTTVTPCCYMNTIQKWTLQWGRYAKDIFRSKSTVNYHGLTTKQRQSNQMYICNNAVMFGFSFCWRSVGLEQAQLCDFRWRWLWHTGHWSKWKQSGLHESTNCHTLSPSLCPRRRILQGTLCVISSKYCHRLVTRHRVWVDGWICWRLMNRNNR
jgi:hypothetical protein